MALELLSRPPSRSFLQALLALAALLYLSHFPGGWATIWFRRRSRDHVPSMKGKVVVVTGATAGIGLRVVRALAAAGATVVLCARSQEKGRSSLRAVLAETPGAVIDVMDLDLASFASVRVFARTFSAKHRRLDVLVLNGGVARTVLECGGFRKTQEGFEEMIGANFLGHFLLVQELLPVLRASPGRPRVVTTSSVAAANSYPRGVDVSTWTERASDYSDWKQYGQSKLCLALMAQELQRREPSIMSVACHPGVVSQTSLLRSDAGILERLYQSAILYPLMMKETDGHRNSVYLASTNDPLVGGSMYHPVGRLGRINVGWLQRLAAFQLPVAMSCGGDDDNGAAAEMVWEAAERVINAGTKQV